MSFFWQPGEIKNQTAYSNAVSCLREAKVLLPTFSDLAKAPSRSAKLETVFNRVDPDDPRPENLFRVHWYNHENRKDITDIPGYIILDKELTGVDSPIVLILGERFPMIMAHKVLAAYCCLVTKLVSGQFDPSLNKAVWPSTGNYCRGGVAISRILGCRSVAVLPEGMSSERFSWLEKWTTGHGEIIRTPGTESNVKEIYDECKNLSQDPTNVTLNQFSEFANYLAHFHCTGNAIETVFNHLRKSTPNLNMAAFVTGTGSGGTLAAGDYLKDRFRTRLVAVEPVECPTMLYNGYGEHNIQGIGDKHIPLIHNIMNTDLVVGVSSYGCDEINVLFNSDSGRHYLEHRRKIDLPTINSLKSLGLSSIANILASIKIAKALDLTDEDLIMTVATDSSFLYTSEMERTEALHFPNGFDTTSAGEVYGQHILGQSLDHVLELGYTDQNRIFNLGYYTWVEQQGIAFDDFDKRRSQKFWVKIQNTIAEWDKMIEEFNSSTGVNEPS